MFIKKISFDQVKCVAVSFVGSNPSFTDHWFFDNALGRQTLLLRTTFHDNKFITTRAPRL
jgi:hypothetical protein